MATIMEYLTYYKNEPFSKVRFNEVDNIIFSEIPYIDWTDIVSNDKSISLQEASNIYLEKIKDVEITSDFLYSIINTLKEMKDGIRYKDCKLSYFKKEVDDVKQFGAICIYFEPRSVYISFQGTDDSIIGWKENFEMSYKFPVASQNCAINYVNEVITWRDRIIYLGGHSKGGNLAMVASMYCKPSIKNRIRNVFNNDGPGFRKKEFSSLEYKRMVSKLKMYIPEESVVGRLMLCPDNYKVVKSTEKGIMQHACSTWECFGTFLIQGTLSQNSEKINRRISNLLESGSDDDREKILTTLFNILEENKINNVNDLGHFEWKKIVSVMDSVKNIDPEVKKMYLDVFRKLILEKT